jgi:hypothetical protein
MEAGEMNANLLQARLLINEKHLEITREFNDIIQELSARTPHD